MIAPLRRAAPFLIYLIAAAAVVVAIFMIHRSGYESGSHDKDMEWSERWAKQSEKLALAKAHEERAAREEEQRRQNEINKVTQDAEQQIAQYRTDAAAADAVAVSLRDQAKRLAQRASQCPSNPNASISGQAATSPAMVLSELFNRCDERAGELAKAFDQCQAAGLACERAYNSLSNTQ